MYTNLVTLIAILTVSVSVSASPTHHIMRRGLPGAYYTCTDPNFSGTCSWTQPNTACHIQGGGGGIESLGPDQGSICTLYTRADCKGDSIKSLRFPGISTNMPTFGSFECVKEFPAKSTEDVVAPPIPAQGVVTSKFGLLKEVKPKGREEGMIGLEKLTYY
ncbi:hypothetical protein CFE70_009097 [Pyrenophora teres f. teres 0-1]|uniref:Uncharacterized protein n=2 Tax=Pyrenophora teres f. teres TaxID=97479 RepID=E3RRX7_PYRTT|nr:hypothetical protein PTT_11618 [Pyrenophora teres f. teres 0-1]KAE8824534.1 hypothetical protein PTNB85_09298 [Pyrenophora teres f. teres]CAA9965196.1 hypothetical protein PTMSG1_08555 [Pyrenophora teres f. maculata]KAE8832029.1 hypothetical protein HRS9139_06271 [Pyrenophora teres f. teres]KAE8835235.1 hypothetical protein HRS9122_07505 [Pyrenophora teres f. teres]